MSELSELRVRDVMSREVATIGRNEPADLAEEVMSLGRIRHLPVVDDDGALVGVVSRRDLFRGALASALGYGSHAAQRALGLLRVKEVMADQPHTTSPDTLLSEAAAQMLKYKIGCLPVLEGGRLVGIVTEGGFVELVAAGGKLPT